VIAAALDHEDERAVIGDVEAPEEFARRLEPITRPAPEASAADFAPRAFETHDRPSRVLARRLADGRLDAEPAANEIHFAEGHAGLRHAEGAGVHAHENDLAADRGILQQVEVMGGTGIDEWIVDVGDGWAEAELFRFLHQVIGDRLE
jgi:hypothetical protein